MSDSLWTGDADEGLRRSTKRLYARIATNEFIEGKRGAESFINVLQKLLNQPEDKTFIGYLVQQSAISHPEKQSRGKGNKKKPYALRVQAEFIAIMLLKERPRATNIAVQKRVYELMHLNHLDEGEFIGSQRTVEKLLTPFFKKIKKR